MEDVELAPPTVRSESEAVPPPLVTVTLEQPQERPQPQPPTPTSNINNTNTNNPPIWTTMKIFFVTLPHKTKTFFSELLRSYYIVSFSYFCLLSLIFGFFIWLIERHREGGTSTDFTDCLFFAVSAMTCTGLTTQNTQNLHGASQAIILLLILMGSSVLVSSFPVLIRRHHFKQRVATIREETTPTKLETVTEMRVLELLLILIVSYYFLCQFLGFFFLRIFMETTTKGKENLSANSIDDWWFSFFISISAFNNAGFSLMADNLMSFDKAPPFLMTVGALILLGNTAYPPTLRFVVWCLSKKLKGRYEDPVQLLLHNPRKYYTHLFGSSSTQWLAFVVLSLTFFQLFFFCVLNWNRPMFDDYLGVYRFFNSLFQSLSTRNAGFNSIDLSQVHSAMQFLIIPLMYVVVYPLAISIRTTRVKEEEEEGMKRRRLRPQHKLQAILTRDLFMILFSIFVIFLIEGGTIGNDPNFTGLKIIFECVSAFGNVGLSLGNLADGTTSFVGAFTTSGKLVMMLTMLVGKHRGLPTMADITIKVTPDGDDDSRPDHTML